MVRLTLVFLAGFALGAFWRVLVGVWDRARWIKAGTYLNIGSRERRQMMTREEGQS